MLQDWEGEHYAFDDWYAGKYRRIPIYTKKPFTIPVKALRIIPIVVHNWYGKFSGVIDGNRKVYSELPYSNNFNIIVQKLIATLQIFLIIGLCIDHNGRVRTISEKTRKTIRCSPTSSMTQLFLSIPRQSPEITMFWIWIWRWQNVTTWKV